MPDSSMFNRANAIQSILDDVIKKLDDLNCAGKEQVGAGLGQLRLELDGLLRAKTSDDALIRAEEELAYQTMLLENVHDAVVAMDAEMNITYWNRKAELISGIPANVALGKKFYDIVHRQNATFDEREADRARIGQLGSTRSENTYIGENGRLVTLESINIALRDASGKLTGYITTSRDITQSKRADFLSRALNDIHQIIHSKQDFDEIMQNAVSAASEALESDTAALSLRSGERWRIQYIYGFPEEILGVEMDDTQERHAVLAIQTGRVVAINDAYNDERVNPDHMRQWGIRSVLVVPVLLRNEVIGVIFFNYQRSIFSFEDFHVDFALKLAASISLALENARLFGKLKKEIAERRLAEKRMRQHNAILKGINRIFEKAISCKTDEELGRVCLSVAEEVTQSKFGFIGEIDQQTGLMNDIAISDPGWDACQTQIKQDSGRLPITFEIHGVYGRVLLDGKAFYTNDPASHPDRVGTPPGHPPLTAFLGVPLVSGGKVFGMVGLGNREGGYLPESLEAIKALAPAIVQSLMNKRAEQAIEQSERFLRESESRLRVALSSVDISVYMLDRDLRYTWIYSPRMELGQDEIIGKRDDALYPRDVAAAMLEAKQMTIDTGKKMQREIQVAVDGDWKYFLLSLEPLIDGSGSVMGLIGASLDLTEQREIEIEHREVRTRMEVQRRLLEQREQDRQAIAREIHDGPVQMLTSTLFNIQFTKEAFPDPELTVELEQISVNLKNTVQELRQVINELRPPSVIRFGLKRAIEFHAEDFHERHPEIALELEVADDGKRLSEQNTLTLYRIYQEAITNIVRHSGATLARVSLVMNPDHLVLEIQDNGRGFDLAGDEAGLTQSGHFGLAGMRERAEAIRGELTILSGVGQGTTVRVVIPLPEKRPA